MHITASKIKCKPSLKQHKPGRRSDLSSWFFQQSITFIIIDQLSADYYYHYYFLNWLVDEISKTKLQILKFEMVYQKKWSLEKF